MKIKELRDYLKQVLDLETALYENSRVKDDYRELRDKSKPSKQSIALPSEPIKPMEEKTVITFTQAMQRMTGLFRIAWAICIAVSIFGILFPICMGIAMQGWATIFTVMLVIGVIFVIPSVFMTWKVRQEQCVMNSNIIKTNHERKERYGKEYQKYKETLSIAAIQNMQLAEAYSKELVVYNSQTDSVVAELTKTDEKLQMALNNLYNKNVIYGKYRNLVAIATLYEYIDSGRCCELEGANGAYNLFESEIRADRIISSLNRVVSNLEDIKNNQHTLYKSIECANMATINILSNINNTQTMTAYYAKQAAVAASADRFIVGMTW